MERFRKDVRPALRAILAAREPLPVEILQRLYNWQDEELRDFTRPFASIFPVASEGGHKVIKPYHKSLSDWLTDEAKAGAYFVSIKEGHRMLAELGWREYEGNPAGISRYMILSLEIHLASAGRMRELSEIQSDPAFPPVGFHMDWVRQRRRLGWIPGSPRSEQKKRHPLLIAYSELRDYDMGGARRYAAAKLWQ